MIKKFIRKKLFREKSSSKEYINYLRNLGIKIGENCTIFSPTNCIIDVQYPWMIEIGDNVQITHGVIILTHDYSWSVLKNVEEKGRILGASGKVIIGNNVFVGMNAIITRGVNIGDNVIIGAGSVVTKDLQSNGVYAGNPCKFIMTIEQFYEKRINLQEKEAKELAINYFKCYGEIPNEKIFHEYFMLFEDDPDKINSTFKNKLKLTGNYNESFNFMNKKHSKFRNFNEFIEQCGFNE